MKTKSPMRGMLTFALFSASGNALYLLLGCAAAAIAFLITSNVLPEGLQVLLFNFAALFGLLSFPLLVITSLGDKDGAWERFQLTMPIKRSDLLRVQYLAAMVAVVIGVALVVTTIFLSDLFGMTIFAEQMEMDNNFTAGIFTMLPTLAMPFLMSGLFFPLATTKLGKGKEAAIMNICQFFALAVMILAPFVANGFGLNFNTFGTAILAVSVVVFIVSYFISRRTYSKLDW